MTCDSPRSMLSQYMRIVTAFPFAGRPEKYSYGIRSMKTRWHALRYSLRFYHNQSHRVEHREEAAAQSGLGGAVEDGTAGAAHMAAAPDPLVADLNRAGAGQVAVGLD